MCPYEHPVDDDGAAPPAPAPLVAGAIGRSVADAADGGLWAAYGRYQVRLEEARRAPTVQG
jgi:hypothetical protein